MEDIPEEVYREKYLKYKKKYLELCQTAGAEGLAAGTKQEQINAKKVELNEQFAAELAASQETLEALYSGANDDQKLQIRKVLATIFGSTGFDGVDEIQGKLYKNHIHNSLKSGSALAFAHGLNIHFGLIEPREDIDVFPYYIKPLNGNV